MERFANEAPKKSLFADSRRDYGAEAFQNAAIETANALYRFGVRKGNLVCLRAMHCIDTVILYAALTYLGALVCLCDPERSCDQTIENNGIASDVTYTIESQCDGLGQEEAIDWECRRAIDGKTHRVAIPLGEKKEEPVFDARADLYAPALIVHTLGVGGKTKGVTMSQYMILNQLQDYAQSGPGREEDCLLQLLPIHHMFGLCMLLSAIWCRSRVYFTSGLDLDATLDAMAKQRVSACGCSSSFLVELAKAKMERGLDFPSLKYALVGATDLRLDDVAYIVKAFHIRVFPIYGKGECFAIARFTCGESETGRSRLSGYILPMCEVRFVDKNNQDVPNGEEGEIIVRGPTVMMGYYNDEQATREAIDEQGYLHTGDIGRLDGKGYFHLLGRKKKEPLRSGVPSPSAIEERVRHTGFFSEVAVVFLPDRKGGGIPVVAVTLQKDILAKSGLTEEGVAALLQEALSKTEIQAVTKILPSLPRLPSGAVDKETLTALLSRRA